MKNKTVVEELKDFAGIIKEVRFAPARFRVFDGINIESHANLTLNKIPDKFERHVAYSFAQYVNFPIILFDLDDEAREMWEIHLKADDKQTYLVQQKNRLRLRHISHVIWNLKNIDDFSYQYIYPVEGVNEIWPAVSTYGDKLPYERVHIAEQVTEIARSAYEKVVENL